MKLETLPKTMTAGNIFKPPERQDILKSTPSRSFSKSSIASTSSGKNDSGKDKKTPFSPKILLTKDFSDDSDSEEEDILSSSIGIIKDANLPEDSFLRRHELYVTDIEDSTDVIFAISPTIR
ncbi:uncharacterized protein CEXT_195341 [Caerostris extrusa]|uniref:Uncharacterized protein n=1 Tax=Caerostris extrusa TaxID=172846 RepID=A0AAV4W429_CAEEX|nr:uncharacterized protein CEXT_195341 [Caerostris extrusa]